MHPHQDSAANVNVAQELAAFADFVSGGYPLVSMADDDEGFVILLQYERHDFVVRCLDECGPARIIGGLVPGVPTQILASSVRDGFALILRTEQIRQNGTEFPLICLGRMPGTKSADTKVGAHCV